MTDKEASQIFGMLYELYQRPIERYLMTLVHDQELAADLCHDTFMRVWKHFTRQETTLPQTDYHVKNWLYATAKHIAIDAHRHNELIDFTTLLPEAEPMVEGDEDRICDLLWLQEEIALMPPRYRDCFLSKHYYGYTQKEIAAKSGISESAVSANVSHGKTHLRRKYYPVTADLKRAAVSSAEQEIDRLVQGLFIDRVWEDWKKFGEIRLHNNRRYTKERIRTVNEERIFYRLHKMHNDTENDDLSYEYGDTQITSHILAWPSELVIIRRAKIISLPADFWLPAG